MYELNRYMGADFKKKEELDMTVKEVVMLAAEELNISTEVAEYLDGTDNLGKTKADRLLVCFNLVENELALDYFPLSKTEKVYSTGSYLFSDLSNAPVAILSVTDVRDQPVVYTLSADAIASDRGTLKITYTFTPNAKTIDQDCDFTTEVSARLMSFGIAAEYAMATGAFEEAALWDKKYKDAIAVLYKRKKGGRIPSRRWA